MAQELLTERHPEQIAGVISCWDRVVIRRMLTTLGCPDGMTAYLSARGIRIFDFQEFAKPLAASVKAHAEPLAAGAGLEINYIRKKQFGDSGAQAEASGGALLSAAAGAGRGGLLQFAGSRIGHRHRVSETAGSGGDLGAAAARGDPRRAGRRRRDVSGQALQPAIGRGSREPL